jgi:hypothetical protein
MYQDYKGFVHADLNGYSNGGGYFSLEDYAKDKMSHLEYSKFIGVNIDISQSGEFSIYFIVKDQDDEIVKHQLKEVNEYIFRHVFQNLSMMIYDKNVAPIDKLKDVYVLETIPIRE